MNTRKRLVAMRQAQAREAGSAAPAASMRAAAEIGSLANPACSLGAGQRCEHSLVDAELNRRLYEYEQAVRGRFSRIIGTLKEISAHQHDHDFAERAQRLSLDRLGYALPQGMLDNAWVSGLDMKALHSHCIFESFFTSVRATDSDQAPWLERMPLTAQLFADCGYHTVDVSPCADGRLQGLLPFVFRMAPNSNVYVKAYAGAMFDVEVDVVDWSHRELERLSGAIPGGETLNYLKIAVYHYSSSHACDQGCAAHGSNDKLATDSALARLNQLREAVENTYGVGAAPDVLLVGLDTDIDALRIHLPDANGEVNPYRYVETATLYRDTLGMNREAARAKIAAALATAEAADGWAEGQGKMADGMWKLVLALVEANFSQIEYVIQHHAGRYAVIGHDEAFICVGEATNYVQLRNKYYYAHLDTVEEGAADMDVGVKIFTFLNVKRGLAVPVLVHFHYSSRVPGARDRAVLRAKRVKAAIEARYPTLVAQGLLNCRMAVSDREGSERCAVVEDAVAGAGH